MGIMILIALWFSFYVGVFGGVMMIVEGAKEDPVSSSKILMGLIRFFVCPAISSSVVNGILHN